MPTGPPKTRLEGSSFSSHMTLGLTAPVELRMFPPTAQSFISHLQTIHQNPPHENSKAQQICSPVCFLRHSFRTTVFHLWVFSTWKIACILTGPFSFMEMNPKHQTLNENFNPSFESENQFLVHRYCWKQGLGIRRRRPCASSCATYWLCVLGRGWISPAWSCSSHLWCNYNDIRPTHGGPSKTTQVREVMKCNSMSWMTTPGNTVHYCD